MTKKYLKYLSLVIPLVLIIILMPTHYANAGILSVLKCAAKSNVFSCFIGGLFAGLVSLIGSIVGFFIGIIAAMINWVLVLPIAGNPVLAYGWTFSRNIVNALFVLGMLMIGISTILRLDSFNVRKTLVRLIIAALLINFSLMIAGVFIDFANVFVNYFLGSIGNVGSKLSDAFGLADFQRTVEAGQSVSALPMFVGLLFTLIMGVLSLIAFAAIFVLFLIRYMTIIILLIVAPFAWFFWVFPELSSMVGQSIWIRWWNAFFKWVLFAPIMLFFMVIAVNSFGALKNSSSWDRGAAANLAESSASKEQKQDPGILVKGVNMIIILALMYGGMKVALEMGITGASYFTNAASKTGNWAKRKTAAMAKGGAELATRSARAYAGEKGGEAATALSQRFGESRLGKIPILNKLGKPLTIAAEKMLVYGQKTRTQDVDKVVEALKNMDPERRKSYMKAVEAGPSGTRKAGLGAYKAQAKQFDNPVDFEKTYYDAMKDHGMLSALDAATGRNQDIRQAEEKITPQIIELKRLNERMSQIREGIKNADNSGDSGTSNSLKQEYEPLKQQYDALRNTKEIKEYDSVVKNAQLSKTPDKLATMNWKAISKSGDEFAAAVMEIIHKISPSAVVDAYNNLSGTDLNKFHDRFMMALDPVSAEKRREKLESPSDGNPALLKKLELMGISFALSTEKAIRKAGERREGSTKEGEGPTIKIFGRYADVPKESKDEGPFGPRA